MELTTEGGAYKRIMEQVPNVRPNHHRLGIVGEGWEIQIVNAETSGILLGMLKPVNNDELLNEALRRSCQLMATIKYNMEDAENRRNLFFEVVEQVNKKMDHLNACEVMSVCGDVRKVLLETTKARGICKVDEFVCLNHYSKIEYMYGRYRNAPCDDVIGMVTSIVENLRL